MYLYSTPYSPGIFCRMGNVCTMYVCIAISPPRQMSVTEWTRDPPQGKAELNCRFYQPKIGLELFSVPEGPVSLSVRIVGSTFRYFVWVSMIMNQ